MQVALQVAFYIAATVFVISCVLAVVRYCTRNTRWAILVGALSVCNPANAADFTAVQSGNWNAPATWNTPTVPGTADYVRIGSAGAVNVTTTRPEFASVVELTAGSTLSTAGSLSAAAIVTEEGTTWDLRGNDVSIPSMTIYGSFLNRGNITSREFKPYELPLFTLRSTDHIELLALYSQQAETQTATVRRVFLVGDYAESHGLASVLRVKAGATGLTVTQSDFSGVEKYDPKGNGSHMVLEIDGTKPGWVLRWANPVGGNQIANMTWRVADGTIQFDTTNGGTYSFTDGGDGFSYVNSLPALPVPELPMGYSVVTLVCFFAACRGLRWQGWMEGE